MIDASTARRIAAHASDVYSGLSATKRIEPDQFPAAFQAARDQVNQALALIGTEPAWQEPRQELQGVQEWLEHADELEGWTRRHGAQNMAVAAMHVQHQAEALALPFSTREQATERALEIFERSPGTWTRDDIADLTAIFFRLPSEVRPNYPVSISQRLSNTGHQLDQLLHTLEHGYQYEHPPAIEALQRYGKVIRLVNDPKLTPELLAARTTELLKSGMQNRWTDDAERAELRMLLVDTPSRTVGLAHSVNMNGLRTDFFANLTNRLPQQLDRNARAWLKLLTPNYSSSVALGELKQIIDRNPASWTAADLTELRALLDLPEGVEPFFAAGHQGKGVGYIEGLVRPNHHDARFEKMVDRAMREGTADFEQMHRHAIALRAVIGDGPVAERITEPLTALIEREPDSLSPSELRLVRGLTLDIPRAWRVQALGPREITHSQPLAELLDKMLEGTPLTDDDQFDRTQYWSAWRRLLTSTESVDHLAARIDSLLARDPASWSAAEAMEMASLVSYLPIRLEPAWTTRQGTAEPFVEFARTGIVSPELQAAVVWHRLDGAGGSAPLIERINSGESLQTVIGHVSTGGTAVQRERFSHLVKTIAMRTADWTIPGAERLLDLVDSPSIDNTTRNEIVQTVTAIIRMNAAPEIAHVAEEASRISEASSRSLHGTEAGFSDYPNFSELGQLRSLLGLVQIHRAGGA
jgi:hypothetical protein